MDRTMLAYTAPMNTENGDTFFGKKGQAGSKSHLLQYPTPPGSEIKRITSFMLPPSEDSMLNSNCAAIKTRFRAEINAM
jgi:hypothetical protein